MQRIDELTILSPTDLANHLACKHLTWLNLKALETGKAPKKSDDDLLEVLQRYGREHEATYLAALEVRLNAARRHVVDMDAGREKGGKYTREELQTRMAATATAMAAGSDALYQPTFYTENNGFGWVGRADFLEAIDGLLSHLGDYAFEPFDTKLAKIAKVNALIQLCAYAEQIEGIQRVAPKQVHVVTGSEEEGTVSIPLSEVSAYYRRVKASLMQALVDSPEHSEPVPNEHCNICRWRTECNSYWRENDDLTFVAGMSAANREKLRSVGVTKLEQLATLESIEVDINTDVLGRLREQAQLQDRSRQSRVANPESLPEYRYLRPIQRGRGFTLLPEPNKGDIFYDIEGHAYRGDKGLEYLHGLAWVESDGSYGYKEFWAHNSEEERQALINVIDFINQRMAIPGFEDLRVYHFGHYEPSALKRLSTQHATYETELDTLLRQWRFVDLSRVVTQGMRIGVESYSIKKLEQMYGFKREDLVEEGKLSIVVYEEWLASRAGGKYAPTGDPKILDQLIEYNRNDCFSTIELREWLEVEREKIEAVLSDEERRDFIRMPLNMLKEEDQDVGGELVQRLNVGRFDRLPDEEAEPLRYKWLLADLLDFHRREQSVESFEFIQMLRMTEDELYDSPNAIVGLHLVEARDYEAPTGRKKTHSETRVYRFDPRQMTRIESSKGVTAPNYHPFVEPDVDKPMFPSLEILDLDAQRGVIELQLKSRHKEMPDPTAIFISERFNKSSFQKALVAIAGAVLDGDEERFRVALDILRRQATRLKGGMTPIGRVDEPRSWKELSDIIQALENSYLAVQGPPGTGKTYSAAKVVLDLVSKKKRVGIAANTHAAVANLIEEIEKHAEDHGFDSENQLKVLLGVKSTDGDVEAEADSVVAITCRNDAKKVVKVKSDFQIIGGTSYLFAREDMRESVDVLFVDEAGQLSLADTLGVSLACRDFVLVGDPQQLKQPTKAAHPGESGLSALEYINQGNDVVPEGYGILLETTKRMHPVITAFVSEQVYEGKLRSEPGCELQAIGGDDWLSGSGLRWHPIEHTGRTTFSPEEVKEVVETFYSVLGREFTDKRGFTSRLEPKDVFLIAPFNHQRLELLKALCAHPKAAEFGVTDEVMSKRVGTVDKAQGDQAPVVLVSYTSSSAEDIPRGMEFLYSKNRFNVAVSRAQALVVVFASPRLLDVHCKTIEQVRLANMLCRYAEVATTA
jgi:uncharacterized protein